jgi:hypothetical protein
MVPFASMPVVPPDLPPVLRGQTKSVQIADLLTQLEANLCASQRYLLVQDIAGLERCTDEQADMARTLQAFLMGGNSSCENEPDTTKILAASAGSIPAAAGRVLHLARTQEALLRSAQRHLATLFHLAIGSAATYRPLRSQSGTFKGLAVHL